MGSAAKREVLNFFGLGPSVLKYSRLHRTASHSSILFNCPSTFFSTLPLHSPFSLFFIDPPYLIRLYFIFIILDPSIAQNVFLSSSRLHCFYCPYSRRWLPWVRDRKDAEQSNNMI